MLGEGRVVAIHPHTDSTEMLFPTTRSEPLDTEVTGPHRYDLTRGRVDAWAYSPQATTAGMGEESDNDHRPGPSRR